VAEEEATHDLQRFGGLEARRRCFRRRTHDSLTRYLVATARVSSFASQSASTRCRGSIEYASLGKSLLDSPPVLTNLRRGR
jgi:hypothetical protein